MVAKTQPVIPPPPPVHLETIYEESGSSLTSSIVDIHHQTRHYQKPSASNSTHPTHGLISARSIPSVDVHRRRRTSEHQPKPPIEVRFRDGTKRYIQPLLTETPMIMNRRKYSPSSRHDSSSTTKGILKHRQIFNITPKKKKKKKLAEKSKIILTIITVEDLSRAGLTPPSTSSPDESDTLALTKTHSNSSLDTLRTVTDISYKEISTVAMDDLSLATVPSSTVQTTEPVVDISVPNVRFADASRHHSQHHHQVRQPFQFDTSRSQSLPASQSYAPSAPSQPKSTFNYVSSGTALRKSSKKTAPSLQITLKGDENEKNSSSKVLPTQRTSKSSSKAAHEATNSEQKHLFQPPATTLGTSGSRSAFRPFLKSAGVTPQAPMPFNINSRSQISTHQMLQNLSQPQQHQVVPSSQTHMQQYPQVSYSNMIQFTWQPPPAFHDHRSISSDASRLTYNSLLSNQISSDNSMNTSSQMRTANYPAQSIMNLTDTSFNTSSLLTDQHVEEHMHTVTVDPNLQWHSVTSKSLYDVPRLSDQYSNIPLRITIPDGTPTHNQKSLHKHDVYLERRLLDAGLSPETIALYERILEVADVRQKGRMPQLEIIDQYQTQPLLSVVKY